MMIHSIQLAVHDTLQVIVTIEKTFLQDLLVILKHSLQNYYKILKKYVFGTTGIVVSLTSSHLLIHNVMLL